MACTDDLTFEQAHATLGAVDACVLLASQESDAEGLIRRVVERGRERADVAEMRVRKSIPDTARAWSIVGALDERLRGVLVEVNAMQVIGFEFKLVAFYVIHALLNAACRRRMRLVSRSQRLLKDSGENAPIAAAAMTGCPRNRVQ